MSRSTFSDIDLAKLKKPDGLFELIEVVGKGTYGLVHKAKYLPTKAIVAVKVMNIMEDEVEEIKLEIQMLQDVRIYIISLIFRDSLSKMYFQVKLTGFLL